MSRLISVMGRLTSHEDTVAALQLVLHLAALAEHLADLRHSQQRLYQLRDARHAANTLRARASATPDHATSLPRMVPTRSATPRPGAPTGGIPTR